MIFDLFGFFFTIKDAIGSCNWEVGYANCLVDMETPYEQIHTVLEKSVDRRGRILNVYVPHLARHTADRTFQISTRATLDEETLETWTDEHIPYETDRHEGVFHSGEIVGLREQLYLSLKRSYRKTWGSINPTRKDLRKCLISLSGLEESIPPVYYNISPKVDVERVSYIKYNSRIIDNLFYISLYKQDFDLCYELFRILVSTFDTDILQIWPIGVHILVQLNVGDFVQKLQDIYDGELPDDEVLEDLAFLQNKKMIKLMAGTSNRLLLEALEQIVGKRPLQEKVLRFLELILRSSRNQHPLKGLYPEQTLYKREEDRRTRNGDVDNGDNGDEDDSDDEESSSGYEEDDEVEKEKRRIFEGKQEDEEEDEEDDEDEKDSDSSSGEGEGGKAASDAEERDVRISMSSLRKRYPPALHRHSAPLHRHGTRRKTPTFLLSYLWMLARTGDFKKLQDVIEPLLLVIPTSSDARVVLADIMSHVIEIVSSDGNTQEKMDAMLDSWERWKLEYTSKRRSKRGIKQYVQWEKIETALEEFQKLMQEEERYHQESAKAHPETPTDHDNYIPISEFMDKFDSFGSDSDSS